MKKLFMLSLLVGVFLVSCSSSSSRRKAAYKETIQTLTQTISARLMPVEYSKYNSGWMSVADGVVLITKINFLSRKGDIILLNGKHYVVESLPEDNILINGEYAIGIIQDTILYVRDAERGQMMEIPFSKLGNLENFLLDDKE